MRQEPGTGLKKALNAHMTEDELLSAVVAMARLRGWRIHHSRPARRKDGGWSTPITGDKGLPDLICVRAPRVIFAELKTELGRCSPDQHSWLGALRSCPGVETYLWRPSHLDEVDAVLR